MNILLIGNAGATNLGDDALLGGFVVLLRSLIPNLQLTIASSNPEETQKLYQCPSVPLLPMGFRSALASRTTLPSTWKAYKTADLIIHGGGGLYTDIPSRYSILLWGTHMLLAQSMHKPYILMGQSLGNLQKWGSTGLFKKVGSKAENSIWRDQQSYHRFQNLLPDAPSTVAPDAAFLLPPRQHILPIQHRENTILISLRPWECTNSVIYKLIPILEQCTEEGLQVCFLPMQRIKEEDISVYNALCARTEAPITLLSPEHMEDALHHIGKATMVIAMRLHACIFATQTATPFVALSYSSKVQEFVEELGLPNQTLPTNTMSFPAIKNTVQQTLETLHAQHIYLNKKRLQLHHDAQEGYSRFLTPYIKS